MCRLCVLCQSEKWVRAEEEPTTSHFWLLQVTSHKQWHFMGRVSSSFLPGFLSIVLPDLANSMCLTLLPPPPPPPPSLLHPHHPVLSQQTSLPPSLPNQTAKLVKTEEGKQKVGWQRRNDKWQRSYKRPLWKWNLHSRQVGPIDM